MESNSEMNIEFPDHFNEPSILWDIMHSNMKGPWLLIKFQFARFITVQIKDRKDRICFEKKFST